ncbi:hypothetical protein CH289_07785 [Rhodococcus sp. RS1C4]|nr:hypothetical protein [Rhodococcus sp. RS1C4]OZC55084.1 hypothetical protein CH289_07785 [Rhodococcus sp. RS1C4]
MTAPIILELPWTRPILSLNDRGATRGAAMAKASKIAELRQTTMAKALHANLPRNCTHVAVELHYRPRTNARRDSDNLFAILKPIADGLVDAGLVEDDDYTRMSRPEPVIHRKGVPAIWLEITVHDTLRSHPE